MRDAFEIALEFTYALAGLTGAWLLCEWVYACWNLQGSASPSAATPLQWSFAILLGAFCGYVGGMSALGGVVSGGWRRVLACVELVFSLIAATAIAQLLVPMPPRTLGTDPSTIEAWDALAFSYKTPHLFVAECVLALIASPPFIISRLRR